MARTAGRCAWPRSAARGFSLVELMIAIMILGLGMVMVATVFPVSLDLTRGTLQINISDAAIETAVSTLELRLPSRFVQMEPYPPTNEAGMVLWPNTAMIELVNSPAEIDQNEYKVRYPYLAAGVPEPAKITFPFIDPNWLIPEAAYASPQNKLVRYWTNLGPAAQNIFKQLSRTFTESSFWDAEAQGDFRDCAYVVASMNITPTAAPRLEADPSVTPWMHSVPYIQNPNFLTNGVPKPNVPAIHLADRVYPPVAIETGPDGKYYKWNAATQQYDLLPTLVDVNNYVAGVARERRYAWTAFARQGGSSAQEFRDKKRTFVCTIALTYRGNLDARYARQQQPTNDGQFNFNNSSDADFKDDVLLMRFPQPDLANGPATDMLFPQPWLVLLDAVNPSGGVITCRGAVARLLPAGAYLVVAKSSGSNLPAGTPLKITDAPSSIHPADLDKPHTLQISRFNGNVQYDVAAWVFPPPINSDRTTFQRNSPVVATAIREVTPDWGK